MRSECIHACLSVCIYFNISNVYMYCKQAGLNELHLRPGAHSLVQQLHDAGS